MKITVGDFLEKIRERTLVRILLPGRRYNTAFISGEADTLIDALIPHYLAMDVDEVFVFESYIVINTTSHKTIEVLNPNAGECEENDDFDDEDI